MRVKSCFIKGWPAWWLLLALWLPGCYTVLRHPGVDRAEADAPSDCASCHDDVEIYHFRDPFMDLYGFGPLGAPSWWYDYYGVPWWYDRYWYYPDPGPGSEVRRGGGGLWGRGPSEAPRIPRVGSSPPRTPPSVGEGQQAGSDEPPKEKPKKPKRKKRRLWGRGSR
jgi:hypothetical protein